MIDMSQFKKIGKNVIYGRNGIEKGRSVHISRFVSIIGRGNLNLGDYAVLADGARILTGTNTYYGVPVCQ